MAKSARASSRKNNNQKLKKNVFGPVEAARTERLSAKLMELVKQQVPEAPAKKTKEAKDSADAMDVAEGADEPTPSNQLQEENTGSMDVDAAHTAKLGRKRIEKRKVYKSSIVFRKYKDGPSRKRR